LRPASSSLATSIEVRFSLKESGAMTIFIWPSSHGRSRANG
jgi:hypothetical protein